MSPLTTVHNAPTHPSVLASHWLRSSAVVLALACASLPAQELISVNFQGEAHGVDPITGLSRLIGPTGVSRCNAMARHDGVLYATAQTGVVGPRQLVTIDPITAHATVVVQNLAADVRGLSGNDGSPELFGIANGTTDQLVRINVVTGQVSNVGTTGLSGLQGLDGDSSSLFLFGWDINVGLVRIDKATGIAVDVNPSVGTQGANIQFLTTFRENNNVTLIGGNSSLFAINMQTGVPTQIGTNTSLADLRGAETHVGLATLFGNGCATAPGSLAELRAKSNFLAGQSIGLFSRHHTPNTIVLLIVGLSKTSSQGTALPLLLDPILGTIGCQLLVSPDLTLVSVANTQGLAPLPLSMPPVLGGVLHFQCTSLEAVPGGLAFSNGLTVETPF